MKKNLVSIIALMAISTLANAEIIKPNVFYKKVAIARSAIRIQVAGLNIKKVATVINVEPNPEYQQTDSATEEISTILETAQVVQATVRYQQNDAGEVMEEQETVNFKLTDFSAEELAVIKGHSYRAKSNLIKNRIQLTETESIRPFQVEYCKEPGFDDYNRPLSDCRLLGTRTEKSYTKYLTLSLK